MSRTIAGRGTHGPLVTVVQQALVDAGFDPRGVDGDYGGHTVAAVELFQKQRGLPMTGTVDDVTWQALVAQPLPGVDVRALALTAAFEGHGYSLALGNFDGAWLTWGIVGFTLKHGEVQKIVLGTEHRHPELIVEAFGDQAADLIAIMRAPAAQQKEWADSLTSGGRLVEPWRTKFARLGSFPQVQAEQRRRAHEDYFEPAVATARRAGLRSELGMALCFDVHVQNGGIKAAAREQIRLALEQTPAADERDVRRAIANAVADHSSTKWRENVRARKLCIADGAGRVHGQDYVLERWGLGETPAPGFE